MSTLFAFLHHLAAFMLVSAIAVEAAFLREEITVRVARRLQIADRILGIAAGAVLVIGLLRVFYFEKGAAYYFSSHAFLTKFSVFILLSILSIVPTVEFLRWSKAIKAGQTPVIADKRLRLVRTIVRAEMIGVVLILLCAAIMARGGFV
jgi:putative membrane protein